MDASKVRGRNEVRVATKHPNEVEEMLDHLPQCVVTDYAQVWNSCLFGRWNTAHVYVYYNRS